ncbi:hypothetical protein HDU87_007249 [Geranomyces variabilis]|uniref:TmcB/TmcC TPR repeats domain-containing protein n=1 Tax=Geranomyces variabilis TaxID=109894 RepID=A0AAD5XMU1_9FUNG|nr:hypothetical protein HDU87_007249 [Geranomyces variabilis]
MSRAPRTFAEGAPPSSLETTVFTLLYTMCKDAEHRSIVAYVLLILEDIQLWAFSWVPQAVFGLPAVVRKVFYPLYFVESYAGYTIMLWLCLATLVATTALIAFTAFSLNRGRFQWMWPLILLRNLSALITTVFFMPFLEIFVALVVCQVDTSGQRVVSAFPEQECFGSNMPLFVLSIVGLLITLPFGLFLNYIYVIPKPDSRNPLAKAHGMLDVLYFLLKTLLVFVSLLTSIEVRLIILMLINLVLIVTYLNYMPHFSHRVNSLRVSIFTSSLGSSIVALASTVAGTSSYAPLGILVGMVPLALAGGWIMTEHVRRGKVQRIMTLLRRRLEMQASQPDENKLRGGEKKPQLLHTALQDRRTSLKRRASSKLDLESGTNNASVPVVSVPAPYPDAGSTEFNDLLTVEQYKTVFARKAIKLPTVFNTPMDADIACRFLRDAEISAASRKLMTLIFEQALEQYPKQAQLALMYTFYLSRWGDDADECLHQLHCAKSNHPTLDVRFRIFMEERDFEQNTRSEEVGASSLNVAAYVEYQSLERQAISSHLASLVAIKAFWAFLAADGVDTGILAGHLNNMHKTQKDAVEYYEKIIARYPSKQILRMYAKYMLTIANNHEVGDQLLKRADDIEHQEGSVHLHPAPKGSGNLSGPVTSPQAAYGLGAVPGVSSVRTETIAESPSGEIEPPPVLPRSVVPSHVKDRDMARSASFEVPPAFTILPANPVNRSLPRKTAFGGMAEWAKISTPETSFLDRDEEQGRQAVAKEQATFGASRSQASSNNSSKEIRRQKARSLRLTENLLAPIIRLAIFVRLCCLCLLGLLIANYLVSVSLFNAPNSFLASLENATRARRGAMFAAQEMRLMSVYAAQGNADIWAYHQAKLSYEYGLFRTLILPTLYGNVNDDATAPILRAAAASFTSPRKVTLYNAYSLGAMLADSMRDLLNLNYADWQAPAITQNIDVRMWLDNCLAIGDAFDGFAQASLSSYISASSKRNIIVVALMLVSVVVIVVTALFINLMIHHALVKQRIVLKALNKISSKDRRKILDVVEEEVEEFLEYESADGEHDAAPPQTRGEKRGSSRTSLFISFLALVFLGAISLSLFIPPLISLQSSDETAKSIVLSNNRRYTFQTIGMLSHELPAGDTNTWAPYRVQHELTYRIWKLQQQHQSLLDGTDGVTSTNNIPELAAWCRTGGLCLTPTGCTNRPFNASIGFTQDVLLSGLDSVIATYLDHAQRFLLSPTYSYDDPNLYFVTNLEDDLADGLTMVDSILLQISKDKNVVYIEWEKILFSVAIIYFVGFYTLSFMRMFATIRAHMAQITSCIFWIPAEISAANSDLTKFMISGIVEVEKDKT